MQKEKPFASLQAVADDSGSDKGDHRLFMAGFLSTAENWALFSEAWCAELQRGKPIQYLKMREANSRTGEFGGWTQEEVRTKIALLKAVIDHFQLMSFHNSMGRSSDWEAFRKVAPRGLGNAHLSCTFGIVSALSRFAASQKRQLKIEFIFDTQAEIEDEVDLFFDHMVRSFPDDARAVITGKPTYMDDKTFAPLQAADMLAWHLRRRHEEHGSWMSSSDDLAPIGEAHLDCGDLDTILASTHEGVAKQMEGVNGLNSKGEWQRLKRDARRLQAMGYVPPTSSSRLVQLHALTRWRRVLAFKGWLRELFRR